MKKLLKKWFSFLENQTQKEINNKLDIIINDLSFLTKEIKKLNSVNKTYTIDINNEFNKVISKSKDILNRIEKLKKQNTEKQNKNIFVWDPNENKYKEYDKKLDFKVSNN